MAPPSRLRQLGSSVTRRVRGLVPSRRRRGADELDAEEAADFEADFGVDDDEPMDPPAGPSRWAGLASQRWFGWTASVVAILVVTIIAVRGVGSLAARGTDSELAAGVAVTAQRFAAQLQTVRRIEGELALRAEEPEAAASAWARWQRAADKLADLGAQLAEGPLATPDERKLPDLVARHVSAVRVARLRLGDEPTIAQAARAYARAATMTDDLEAAASLAIKHATRGRRAAQRRELERFDEGQAALAMAGAIVLILVLGLGLGRRAAPAAAVAPADDGDAWPAPPPAMAAGGPGGEGEGAEPVVDVDVDLDAASGPAALGAQHERLLRCALDHLEVGVVVVDAERTLVGERSLIAAEWFGAPPEGGTLDAWLGDQAPDFVAMLRDGWAAVLEAPAEARGEALAQLPVRFAASGRVFDVRYSLLDELGPQIDGAVLVFTDVTSALAAEELAHIHAEFLQLAERFNIDRRGAATFADELAQLCGQLLSADSKNVLERWLRELRETLAAQGVANAAEFCRDFEHLVQEQGDLAEEERKRVVGRVEEVINQAKLLAGDGHGSATVVPDADLAELAQLVFLEVPLADIGAAVARLRYEPARRLLSPVADAIRQGLAAAGRGEAEVKVEDHGVRVDGAKWRPFFGALVRFARDHVCANLETPEQRAEASKEPNLSVVVEVEQSGGELVVRITDDGAGVSEAALQGAAERAGRDLDAPENAVDAIFSDIVGGVLVARTECFDMGGQIQVATSAGEGTTVTFRFPSDAGGVLTAAA